MPPFFFVEPPLLGLVSAINSAWREPYLTVGDATRRGRSSVNAHSAGGGPSSYVCREITTDVDLLVLEGSLVSTSAFAERCERRFTDAEDAAAFDHAAWALHSQEHIVGV